MDKKWIFYGLSFLNIIFASFFIQSDSNGFVGRPKLYNIQAQTCIIKPLKTS